MTAVPKNRSWQRAGGWVLGVVGVLVAAALLWHAWQAHRRQALDQRHRANLKALGLALEAYHDRHGSFPPAYLNGPDGKPAHSWRALLLPQLGEQALYDRVNFAQPWDAPANQFLATAMPAAFAVDDSARRSGTTPYQAIVGSQTMWPGPHACRINDIMDGTGNTIMLVESLSPVAWTQPADVAMADWTGAGGRQPLLRRTPPERKGLYNLRGDGSAVLQSSQTDRRIVHALATCTRGRIHPALKGKPLPGEAASSSFGDIPSRTLTTTDIVPARMIALRPGRNALWCASFQLSFQELLRRGYPRDRLLKTDVVRSLLDRPFPEADLDPAAYFVGAGFRKLPAVQAALRAKFPAAELSLLNEPPVEYWYTLAYLEKALPFTRAFQKPEKPLEFVYAGGRAPVKGFGLYDEPGADPAPLLSQIKILHDTGPRDVVAALQTVPGDEVIVAQGEPGKTLGEAWDRTRAKIEARRGAVNLLAGETLLVPMIGFATTAEFDGLALADPEARITARQGIRFQLDENGAKLESFSEVIDSANGHEHAVGQRHFWFDRPFLLALRQRGAREPYLLLWVGDADLLLRAGG